MKKLPRFLYAKKLSMLIWPLVLLWAIVLLLCWNSDANASPFLVCDFNSETLGYSVDMDGVIMIVPAQVGWIKANVLYLTDPGGTTTKCHVLLDLAALPVGTHVTKAQGEYGTWGVSAWSVPFSFPKPTLTPPQGARLAK